MVAIVTVAVVLLLLLVLLMGLVFLTQRLVVDRLDRLETKVEHLGPGTAQDAVARLGRSWPTPDELAAARNRIDQGGTAHAGSADPNIRVGR